MPAAFILFTTAGLGTFILSILRNLAYGSSAAGTGAGAGAAPGMGAGMGATEAGILPPDLSHSSAFFCCSSENSAKGLLGVGAGAAAGEAEGAGRPPALLPSASNFVS